MKRTAEVILSIVGAVVYAGLAIVGIFIRMIGSNEDIKNDVTSEMINEDPTMSAQEVNDLLDVVGGLGWYVIVVSIIAIILGIVAMFMLKGNKMPKAAGIILIVTAVISTIATAFMGLFCALFYLIAGIMALVRKPPRTVEM
ncbi:hypothetical protein JNUCC1_02165 [Lentibacillus sp. JNUCC-1]|uniref:DUF4064 domain-containing protein n=1 Tax=Lentibacillus sp. JNUCC-1 TaxID=2654513 RepID=UPI0012E88C84|nr:DUF4064 domain-containing protein [Lentibacillus sp. JNUCC-1]MUV38327.1 hypothetical protein [Lentibacillus sp. JNUCC-1]